MTLSMTSNLWDDYTKDGISEPPASNLPPVTSVPPISIESLPTSLIEYENVYVLLKRYLPKYDMEVVADRYLARQKLMNLKIAASVRSQGMSGHPDSLEDQANLSVITELFEDAQNESLLAEDEIEG